MINHQDSPSAPPWRFERKYRISELDCHRIRMALTPYMQPDPFTKESPEGSYVVRSLYFDTDEYRLYHEKMDGDHNRVKLRFRVYRLRRNETQKVHVEMKIRQGNAMEKHGAWVSMEDCEHFLKHRHWADTQDPVLLEFERYIHILNLRAKVLIDYRREGYEDRECEKIRITFDHRASGVHSDSLFPKEPVFFRRFHENTVVLEIKSRYQQPCWLRNLIRNYGLCWVANSKFAHAIQTVRHDLVYPEGIVVVR